MSPPIPPKTKAETITGAEIIQGIAECMDRSGMHSTCITVRYFAPLARLVDAGQEAFDGLAEISSALRTTNLIRARQIADALRKLEAALRECEAAARGRE